MGPTSTGDPSIMNKPAILAISLTALTMTLSGYAAPTLAEDIPAGCDVVTAVDQYGITIGKIVCESPTVAAWYAPAQVTTTTESRATVQYVPVTTTRYAPSPTFVWGGSGGETHVSGYTRRDGTYVAPHYRSAADGNPWNNWSTRGNRNPHTGVIGTRMPRLGGRHR